MDPPVAVQVTPVANAPVPFTLATQVEVWDVVMEDGLATTEIPLTVGTAGVAGASAVLMDAVPVFEPS
jgi:hypothetical protein